MRFTIFAKVNFCLNWEIMLKLLYKTKHKVFFFYKETSQKQVHAKSKCWFIFIEDGVSRDTLQYKPGVIDFKGDD